MARGKPATKGVYSPQGNGLGNCKWCGVSIMGRSGTARTCDNDCKQALYRFNKKRRATQKRWVKA